MARPRTSSKTPKMLEIEERIGAPLEEEIPRLYKEHGDSLQGVADNLGITRAALFTWMIRLGLSVHHKIIK